MKSAIYFGWLVLAIAAPSRADNIGAAMPPPLPAASGIGAILNEKNGTPVITEVLPHSPAAGAGLQAQDRIVWVNYRDVTGLKLEEVVNLIRGETGTTVAITVKHPGDSKPHTYTLTRAPIRIVP